MARWPSRHHEAGESAVPEGLTVQPPRMSLVTPARAPDASFLFVILREYRGARQKGPVYVSEQEIITLPGLCWPDP